jgi:hypothetical protein
VSELSADDLDELAGYAERQADQDEPDYPQEAERIRELVIRARSEAETRRL